MRIISNNDTIFQFKIGDIIKPIEEHKKVEYIDSDGNNKCIHFWNECHYTFLGIKEGYIITKKNIRSNYELHFPINNENISGWILNRKWLREKRKTHYYITNLGWMKIRINS